MATVGGKGLKAPDFQDNHLPIITELSYGVICAALVMVQLQQSFSKRLRRVFQLQRGLDGPQDASLLWRDQEHSQ